MLDNLFQPLPIDTTREHFDDMLSRPGLRIERIVSFGQTSPPGFWYDQPQSEWVVVLSGSAGVRLEHEASERHLRPGDSLELPAHCRHRVEWTDSTQPTIWLAVHWTL
ncbi:cupin domain-containing protein [Pseudomonas sp. GD03860]|uniref:cupin domain-containing protein n=1 Tax=Pseudomonas TaxID=286 RepID=UPI002363EDA5|nr:MULTISPECIES: cupin domain-containing protein [Pseudomonas]MDD2058792.1 cupin domain-containing protein [Pseudomonas putida]MDH0637025.1 cupin domain-containing protein [Pseudomonas sp. GD03860]